MFLAYKDLGSEGFRRVSLAILSILSVATLKVVLSDDLLVVDEELEYRSLGSKFTRSV